MKRETINNIDKVTFDGFSEFLSFMKSSEGKTVTSGRHLSSEEGGYEFCKTRSFSEAIKLAESGWEEGTNLVKQVLDKVSFVGKGVSFSPVFEVSGESVEVGRFLSGEPECMQEWEMIESKGNRVVDIYFNVISSGSYSTSSIINYGAVALSVVDYLESINVRVNLYSYYSIRSNGMDRMVCVKIKSAEDALNIPTCAFAIAHPSMQRRFMFKCLEVFSNFHSFGYGSIAEHEKERYAEGNEVIVFQTINNTRSYFRSEEDTKSYLKTKLSEVLNEMKIDLETNYDFIH